MRHVIPTNGNSKPYLDPWGGHQWYTFKKPTKDRAYVKVLKFVEKHPKCHRKDIQRGVWGKSKPGLCSTLFSQMLFADLIDYNSKFEYKVTRKGKNLLRKVMK